MTDIGSMTVPLTRTTSTYLPLTTYTVPTSTRSYTHQFSDTYFSRLALLKAPTAQHAESAWSQFRLGSSLATRVDRVLDVRQGELCWIVGTVFMEMPLKPNVLDDVGREHWISAPVLNQGKFFTEDSDEEKKGYAHRKVMLEDESGRLRLTGDYLDRIMLVTGAIVGVLGTENKDGEFEVLDVKVPDLARQPVRWERDDAEAVVSVAKGTSMKKPGQRGKAGKIALISGLGISGDADDMLPLELLTEYLLGEAGGESDAENASHISRLIIVGNSLSSGGPIPSREELAHSNTSKTTSSTNSVPTVIGGTKKYGYDSSAYNSAPTDVLDSFIANLLPSLPITLLPGDTDPASTALPQQPIHPALFPRSRNYMPAPTPPGQGKKDSQQPSGWFHSVTNPWEGDVDGWRILATGGQPIEDMCRYIPGDDRCDVMESILRWRVAAPTCPDTLWCYPFQESDLFVMKACPHVYIAGNQPKFETTTIEGENGQSVRLIALSRFIDTGEIILLDAETLETEVVKFDVFDESQ